MRTMQQQESNERGERGAALFERIVPGVAARLEQGLKDIAPDMVGFLTDFAAGDVLARPGLDMQAREMATVAALAAMGTAPGQLRVHIAGALHVGLSPEQVVEIFYVVMVFAGFPAALNAIEEAREVFAARGIDLPLHPEPYDHDQDRHERGAAALAAISADAGQAVVDQLEPVCPDMAGMIIDFSYGDVLARPGLSPRLKEIAVLAAATAKGTMAPQLKVHIAAARTVGVSRTEIVETVLQMAVYAGFPAALNGLFAVREVLGDAPAEH